MSDFCFFSVVVVVGCLCALLLGRGLFWVGLGVWVGFWGLLGCSCGCGCVISKCLQNPCPLVVERKPKPAKFLEPAEG